MNNKLHAKSFTSDIALLIYIALVTAVCHIIISGNYGYFLDELYTIACSRHISLAFVDIPPVAPALLALNTAIFGDSLPAIHILPSLFSGAAVIMTGLMAREMGGGKLAVVLAGLSAAFVPVWMALGSLYTYDFLDQFLLIAFFYVLILLLKRENPKLWLIIGFLAGMALMTKPSAIFFIAALAVGLLFTKHRRWYATRWPWLGAFIAFIIILPALIWQAKNNFPIVEYWGAYSTGKAVHADVAEFILMQIVGMNFILLPVWSIGLYYFLFHKRGRQYILLGAVFVILFILFLAAGAKMYMLIPAYAMLLASGSVVLERIASKKRNRILVAVYSGLIVITGIIQAPNFMPILPVQSLIHYYDTIGGIFGVKSIRLDNGAKVELPQYFYDRLEWDVLVRDVAEVYHNLPEAERSDTAIVTQNYGWAGAIDLFGEELGLPNATCGQLNYYFFSLENLGKKTWIMIGESRDELLKVFNSVTIAKISETKYRKPNETLITICREPRFSVEEAIVGIKKFG